MNCCVTSPPYWGLRDYGTAKWKGGAKGCDHKNGPLASAKSTLQGYTGDHVKLAVGGMPQKAICQKCGAVRVDSQLGLEKTPEEYTARMVEVFREVRRVLRDDGTLWLNLGDSYAGGKTGRDDANRPNGSQLLRGEKGYFPKQLAATVGARGRDVPAGLKPKDLVGIPWRVAFALQADGWYLRSDIIWHKPNPMPESVTDRPTKAHEYLFLLTKSARYAYDADAIREPLVVSPDKAAARQGKNAGNKLSFAKVYGSSKAPSGNMKPGAVMMPNPAGRNRRSVWTVGSKPYKGAHFATFPPALIEPCILAGCPRGGVVLDPFSGAGTTGVVAQQHGRRYVGIELNAEYVKMSERRIRDAATRVLKAAA